MANVNAPFGFKLIGSQTNDKLPQAQPFTVTTSQTICVGDPVIKTSSGTVSIATAGLTTGHLGIAATATQTANGSSTFPNGAYAPAGGTFGAAPAGQGIMVYTDPMALYAVQCYTSSAGTPAQTIVFGTYDVYIGTGSTTTGQSACALNIAAAATGVLPWEVLWLYPDMSGKNAWGANAVVVVRYNPAFIFGMLTTMYWTGSVGTQKIAYPGI